MTGQPHLRLRHREQPDLVPENLEYLTVGWAVSRSQPGDQGRHVGRIETVEGARVCRRRQALGIGQALQRDAGARGWRGDVVAGAGRRADPLPGRRRWTEPEFPAWRSLS